MGVEGLEKRYRYCLEIAEYCKAELIKIGIDAWMNKGSITVVFPKVSDSIKEEWQLATDEITHVICMPNVTKIQIDKFIADIIRERKNQKSQL